MPYVLRRKTDGQFKTGVNRYFSSQPRWTTNINNARVYNRRCDVSQSREGYPINLIEAVPIRFVVIKEER